LLGGLLLTAFIREINLNSNQLASVEFVSEERLNSHEKQLAARLIQLAFRRYRAHKRFIASQGVPILTINENGVSTRTDAEIHQQENISCFSAMINGNQRAPTQQQILKCAKRNRQFRYYRFVKLMEQNSR
jgi:hypothetical protein